MLGTSGPAETMKWVMYLGQKVGSQQKLLPKHGCPSNCPPNDWANQPYLAHGVGEKGHGCTVIVEDINFLRGAGGESEMENSLVSALERR